MAYMSAREMLSRFPMKMAEGGPVTYGKGATAADLLAAEEAYLANPSAWPPETAYAAILESGISMDDARAAGVADDTIDAIFTTPTALAGDQLSSQGQASFMDSGSAFADSITQAGVDAYKTKIMEDSEVSPEERREMQQIATEQGVTYQDMIGLGFDPNWLYDTPAPAAPTPAAPTPAAPTPAAPTPAAPPPADADYIDPFPQTQVPYTAPTVYQPLPDNTGVYAAGEESLDTTFRESAPRTEVLDSYGNLTNFDYTPAAKLRSATGSGYNWTPPTVTGRPRSLMGADLLARYTGGRAAADLRQLTTGLGNGRTYSDYTGVLQNPGSYGGGLSKSQLYSRMRGLDYQRDAAAAADRVASTPRGGIAAYLAANPDIGASYESQKDRLGGQSLQQFARNHYNTTGKAEMVAGTRGLFTLVADTPVSINPMSTQEDAFNGGFGEGEGYETSNWNQRYDMGEAGGVYRPFAHGGSVKKPEGFADGGTASADLLEKTAGVPGSAKSIYNYGKDVVTAPSPSAKLLADAMGVVMKVTNDPVQYGAELLGFDDARQLAIMREAVAMTNELVDNGYLNKSSRVKLVGSTDDSSATRENVHIEGNEEVFNAVNHALFSYYAGQNPIAGLGAQIKEVKQGLQQIDRGNNPRTEYLDYFNNQFGLNLAKQGLSPADAKYQIMANIGNIAGKGTRGRMQRGEEIKAGTDLLTNYYDATGVARYPWEKYAESVMDDADKLRAENPQGFADGGTASADLKALDPTDSLFITEDIVEEVNPDNVQRDIPRMEWDGVDRPTPMETETETESKNMLETLASGYPKAVNTVANYVVRGEPGVDMSLIPMGELASDTKALGGMLYEALKEDPVAFFAENLPVVAQIVAGRDMNEFTGLANEARVSGDSGLADMYEQIVVLSAAGIIPGGAAANKAAKTTAIKAARDAAKATASDSASMLDEVDKPIVVYRGTTANESTVRPFTHTSTNPSTASGFAGYVDAAEELGIPQIPEEGGNVMKMLADVKNIATLEDIKRIAPETKTRQEAYPLLQKAGFDSYQDNYELVVFDPSDLKSAYDPLVGTDAAKMLDEVDRAITASRESAEDTFGPGTSQVTYLDEASGGTITMLERPDGKPASVLELLVPEAERRKGVGARLQAHALQMHPNMMGQVSSRYAAKSAYDLGRRPFDAPDATLEDVYKLIEENSSVNLVSQAQGTGSLPVSGPDAPATNTNVLSGIQAEDVFSLTDRNAAGMTSDMVDYQTAGILSRHPNYFKESKDIDYEIRNMSPDEYLKKASKILSKSSKRTPQEIIEYKKTDEGADYISLMAQSMRNGQVYAAPFLDYGSGGYGRSQEGMHRALAAKQLGMEEIPVMVLDSFKNPASPYRSALNELDTPPKPIKKANGGRIERVYNDLRYI